MDHSNNQLKLHENIFLSERDRKQNILLSGLPSTGVTVYFTELMKQDIQNGLSTIIFDPYGDIATDILISLNKDQLDSTAYIDVGNQEYPVGINLLQANRVDEKLEIANTVMNIMYSLFDPKKTGIIGPRFEQSVRNAIATVLYDNKSTLLEVVRVLTDQDYIKELLPKINDPFISKYWTDQIAKSSDNQKSEILEYVISKFMPFVTNKKIRNMVGQSDSTLNFDDLITNKKVILFDFSKLQEDSEVFEIAKTIIIFKLLQVIRFREDKSPLSVFIDQVEDYPVYEMSKLLRNSRRYGVNLALTTQRLAVIQQELLAELLRVGTLISFRQSTDNASIIAPEFHKGITTDKLCMLPRFHMYMKILQEGTPVVHEDIDTTNDNFKNHDKSNVVQIKTELSKAIGQAEAEVDKEIKSKLKI